jgi:hypothetical protein
VQRVQLAKGREAVELAFEDGTAMWWNPEFLRVEIPAPAPAAPPAVEMSERAQDAMLQRELLERVLLELEGLSGGTQAAWPRGPGQNPAEAADSRTVVGGAPDGVVESAMLEGLEAQLVEVGATAAAAEFRGLAGEDRALLLEMLMQLDTDVPGPAPQPQPDPEPAGRQHSAGEARGGARAAAAAEAEARTAREVLAEMGLSATGGAGEVAGWGTFAEGEAASVAQEARLAGMIDGLE